MSAAILNPSGRFTELPPRLAGPSAKVGKALRNSIRVR